MTTGNPESQAFEERLKAAREYIEVLEQYHPDDTELRKARERYYTLEHPKP